MLSTYCAGYLSRLEEPGRGRSPTGPALARAARGARGTRGRLGYRQGLDGHPQWGGEAEDRGEQGCGASLVAGRNGGSR